MQVRRADQALYHHELTVSSLGSVCQSCTAPLHEKKKIMNHNKTTQVPKRSFTSVQMVHTHMDTHTYFHLYINTCRLSACLLPVI